MNRYSRLVLNEDQVAAKVLDGEAIMINIANGTYYSLDNVGGLVWELVEGGCNLEGIVAAVVARYDVSPDRAQADIDRLAAELVQENLVTVSSDGVERDVHPPVASGTRSTYDPPSLNVYRDMADLLALDPPAPGLQQFDWQGGDNGS